MGVIANILGSGEVIKEGFKLIDSMHTSDAEEIAAKTKAKVDLLNSYSKFKVTQRFLAMLFGFTYVGSFLLLLSITLYNGGNTDNVKTLLNEFYLGEITLTIVAFYFGGGAFEGVINKFKGNK